MTWSLEGAGQVLWGIMPHPCLSAGSWPPARSPLLPSPGLSGVVLRQILT